MYIIKNMLTFRFSKNLSSISQRGNSYDTFTVQKCNGKDFVHYNRKLEKTKHGEIRKCKNNKKCRNLKFNNKLRK